MIDKYSINTTQNVNIDLEIAGIGDRLIALIIDYLIIGAIGLGMWSLVIASGATENFVIILIALYGGITFFFHFIMESTMNGQSIGKKFRNIRVVHKTGREAGIFHYLIRNLIRPLDMFYGLGALIIFFTPRSQRLGDIAAGTLVIKLDKQTQLSETAFAELDENYEPNFEKINVLRLTQNDIELIKEVSERPVTKMNWELVRKTAEKMQEKMQVETNEMNNLTLLKQLVKDYNYHNLN